MAAKIIQKSDFENILSLSFEYQNQLKLKGFLQNSANDLKQLKLNANKTFKHLNTFQDYPIIKLCVEQ